MTDLQKTVVDLDPVDIFSNGKDDRVDLGIPEIELDEIIGRGGAGVVYRGRQPYLKRDVAVKVLNPDTLDPNAGSHFNERFQREAQILANLVHPNIVSCYQAGLTSTQQPYIAMEFIDGPTLDDYIKAEGHISVALALQITLNICEALKYAYSKKIIHRDIKAENILLKPDASGLSDEFHYIPKLADLGIARSTEMNLEENITVAGMVVGTPGSMAPEQFYSPEKVGFPADIYGLGCVLYQMLTARKPFSGNKLADIVTRKLDQNYPQPSSINSQVEPPLQQLLGRMLAPDIEDRPSSYQDLIAQIENLLKTPNKVAKKSFPTGYYLLAMVVIVSVAGYGYWSNTPPLQEQPDSPIVEAQKPDETRQVSAPEAPLPTVDTPPKLQDIKRALVFSQPPTSLISKDFAAPLADWQDAGGNASWITEDEGLGVNGIGSGSKAYKVLPGVWQLRGSIALLTQESKEAGVALFMPSGKKLTFSLKQLGKIYLSITLVGADGELTSIAFKPLQTGLQTQQRFSLTFAEGLLQFQAGDDFIGALELGEQIDHFALFVEQSTASFRGLELFTKETGQRTAQ